MLQIPEVKFRRSVNKNNVGTEQLADWIEASLLFDENKISKSDVVDVLEEQEICDSQDLAREIVDEGWSEIRKRIKSGNIPTSLQVKKESMSDTENWENDPIRSFFLMLSIFKHNPAWAAGKSHYSTQGELFEKVVEYICSGIFPDWIIYRNGWSSNQTDSFQSIAKELIEKLSCQGCQNLDDWSFVTDKDRGLDLVCFKKFPDDKEAQPTYFIQCASGANWTTKINTPSANTWQKLLDSALLPGTGIAVPFIIDEKNLRIHALEGQKVILDRLRLLCSFYSRSDDLGEELKSEVVSWLGPLIGDLLKDS